MKANSIENKINKREQIIDAASVLFSSRKYHEVMMEDIAKSVSIAKGTLYNYFTSKDDLYFSIMLTRMEHLYNSLYEKINATDNPVEAMHSFIVHNYMFMMKYQCFFKIYRRDNADIANESADSLNNKRKSLKNLLIGIIESGVNNNFFNPLPAGFTADMILGIIYSAVERGIRKKSDKTESEEERERVFQFILRGIAYGNYISNLSGKTILVTRSKEELKEIRLLELFGTRIISFPVINIVPVDDWKEFDRIVTDYININIIIFTSSNAVELFYKRCTETNTNLNYENIKIAVTGSSTAEACHEFNIPVDYIPSDFSAEGLIKLFSGINLQSAKIFIPGSKISKKDLPEQLEKMGAHVKVVSTYSVEIPDYKNIQENIIKVNAQKPHTFVFTSPSSFKNYMHIMSITDPKEYFNDCIIVAIGPSTKYEIEQHGIQVQIQPQEHTMKGIFNSILKYYNNKSLME